ncbi:MAG: response regulator [Arcobacter sp.]|nr:response regulator [Arcobacter sp.]
MSQYSDFLSTVSIMYVDNAQDSDANVKFFELHCKKVLHFRDGLEALEIFEKDLKNNTQIIDLIITDVQVPILDGFSLIRKIRELKPKMPIFIFTDSKAPNNVVMALKLRITNYLFKPLDNEDILLRIYDTCFPLHEERIIKNQNQQLEQYLEVINNVAIISKTDTKGVITFVNDIFCEVSQYTREELLGQPHNILRHPDMPKEAFKDLWSTIKNGHFWKGKVKNKAKDGSSYNVNATISPIYDINQTTIVGYMAVRFLTTEDDEKQREFKNQVMQSLKDARLKEAEYKKTIKDLAEKVHLSGDTEYLMNAFEEEKRRTTKMKAQLGFYEVEIKKVEQKGFDIGNKFKSELIKSLTTTKALQLKAGQLEKINS